MWNKFYQVNACRVYTPKHLDGVVLGVEVYYLHTGIFSSKKLDRSARSRRHEMSIWKLLGTQYLPRPPRPIPPPHPNNCSDTTIHCTYILIRTPHISLYLSLWLFNLSTTQTLESKQNQVSTILEKTGRPYSCSSTTWKEERELTRRRNDQKTTTAFGGWNRW